MKKIKKPLCEVMQITDTDFMGLTDMNHLKFTNFLMRSKTKSTISFPMV